MSELQSMSYSDFTLKKVKEELNVKVVENRDMFSHIKEIEASDILLNILKYNVPLAIAIGTEKARSEMIVVNVLIEVKRILVQEGGNIQTTEKSDFLKKSDFFDFWVVRKLSPSCTSAGKQKYPDH